MSCERLRARTLGDLLAETIPERRPLLGTWLVERHLCMLYAPTGVGKSWAALSIALAVAAGGSFLGWKAPEPRPVLYVDGEMDVIDLQERARAILAAMPDGERKAAETNFVLLAQQDQEAGVGFPDLAAKEGGEVVMRLAQERKASLVILDNFSTLANVEDENAASSFNPILDLLLRFKHAGVAGILVHHAKKGSGGRGSYRGTSKMAVVFNSIVALNHPGGVQSTNGVAFDLTWDKFRGKLDGTIQPLSASFVDGVGWTFGVSETAQLTRLCQAVESCQYGTQAAVAKAIGMSAGWVSGAKGKAIAKGLITETRWSQCLEAALSGDDLTPDGFAI